MHCAGFGHAAALASPPSPLARQLAMLRIDAAARASLGGDPDSMQRRYDAARDLAESTRRAVTPKGCDRLQDALTAFAEAEIAVTEAYDRLRPWRAAQRHAEAARRRVERIRPVAAGVSPHRRTPPGGAVPAGRGRGLLRALRRPRAGEVDQGTDRRQRGKRGDCTGPRWPVLGEGHRALRAGARRGALSERRRRAGRRRRVPRCVRPAARRDEGTREAATRPRALGPARSGGTCLQRLFVGTPRATRGGDRRGVERCRSLPLPPRPSSSP